MSFNPAVEDGTIYLAGREDLDGSLRFTTDSDTGATEIQKRITGLWQPADFETGPSSLRIGRRVSVASIGSHLATESVGHLHLHAHSEYDGETCIKDAKMLNIYSFTERLVYQPDESGSWTGTLYEFVSPSPAHTIVSKGYLKTHTTPATKPIRIQTWLGTDDTGELIFDQWYPTSQFPASSEVEIEYGGALEFEPGNYYFTRYSSAADFSMKMNAAGTFPWVAADLAYACEDNMLQTAAYIDGDTYALDQYLVHERKIYVCNTAGVQTGTFESNSALWNEVVHSGDLEASNFWSRTGTTVTPVNAGDNIQLTGGDILAPNGSAHLTLSNAEFSYNNGTRDRLKIPSNGRFDCFSPDGSSYTMLSDGSFGIILSQDYRLALWPTTTYITGPGSNPYRVTLNNSNYAVKDATRDRIVSNGTQTEIVSPNGNIAVIAANAGFVVNDGIRDRIQSTSVYSGLTSPTGTWGATLSDGGCSISESGVSRIMASDQMTSLISPDEGSTVDVANAGVTITGVTTIHDGIRGRVTVNGTHVQLMDPAGNSKIEVDNNGIILHDGTYNRVVVTSTATSLASPNSSCYLLLENASLIYNDGTYDRFLVSSSLSKMLSGSGEAYVSVSTTVAVISDGTRDRIIANTTTSKLVAPGGSNSIDVNNTDIKLNDGTSDRLHLSTTQSYMKAPNGTSHVTLTDTNWSTYLASKHRFSIDSDRTRITDEPTTGGGTLTLETKAFTFSDGTRNRVYTDATYSALVSPDGSQKIEVGNTITEITGELVITGGCMVYDGYQTRLDISALGATILRDERSSTPGILSLENQQLSFHDGTASRLAIDSGLIQMYNGDGTSHVALYDHRFEYISTDGAFVVSKMTTTQRDAIVSTVNGSIIYNTTTNQFNFHENGSWVTK